MRRLLRFQRDERAIRENENGAAAFFAVFLHRVVIHEVPEIMSFHAATIHRISGSDSGLYPL